MVITYIRSSSYNNYEYCEMQYFITYVLGHQSISGKKAQLGTIVHKVMECLASCKKRLQYRENKQMSITDDALGKIKFSKRQPVFIITPTQILIFVKNQHGMLWNITMDNLTPVREM